MLDFRLTNAIDRCKDQSLIGVKVIVTYASLIPIGESMSGTLEYPTGNPTNWAVLFKDPTQSHAPEARIFHRATGAWRVVVSQLGNKIRAARGFDKISAFTRRRELDSDFFVACGISRFHDCDVASGLHFRVDGVRRVSLG
jgi:hypothetical protein